MYGRHFVPPSLNLALDASNSVLLSKALCPDLENRTCKHKVMRCPD